MVTFDREQVDMAGATFNASSQIFPEHMLLTYIACQCSYVVAMKTPVTLFIQRISSTKNWLICIQLRSRYTFERCYRLCFDSFLNHDIHELHGQTSTYNEMLSKVFSVKWVALCSFREMLTKQAPFINSLWQCHFQVSSLRLIMNKHPTYECTLTEKKSQWTLFMSCKNRHRFKNNKCVE